MHAKCGGFNVSLIDAYAQSHVDLLNGTPPLWRGFHLENKTAAENKYNVIKLRSLKKKVLCFLISRGLFNSDIYSQKQEFVG